MNNDPRDNPPYDKDNVRYCLVHEMHWIPAHGMSNDAASCPWCRIDKLESLMNDGWIYCEKHDHEQKVPCPDCEMKP